MPENRILGGQLTAVITDVHYRMSLALIRTLGERGLRVVCCEYQGEKYPLGFYSKHCRQKYTLPDQGGLDALYRICEELFQREGEKPVLFPVGVKTLHQLAKSEEMLRFKKVAHLLIPSEEQLNQFNDKKTVAEIARKNGVSVPEEYAEPYSDGIFPCIVKPACGEKFGLSAAKRYYIAKDPHELDKYRDVFRKITGEEPIVQKYLSGAGAGCSVLCRDGKVISAICHRRLREYPVTGGPSTCCRSFYSDELMDVAEKMVAAVRYNGIAMLEFKYDREGKPHLLEINPRIWGTFPLVRVVSSDLIDRWLELSYSCSEGSEHLHSAADSVRDSAAHRLHYRERKMIYGCSDLIGAIGYAKKGKIGTFFSAVADALNPFVADGLWEWSDIKPGILYLKSLLKRRR